MRRVLLVDDDRAIRELLTCALEYEGYEVTSLPDGSRVVALLEAAEEPCIVLMDLMMPRMDGWAVCRALANRPELLARHPVVLMSAGSPPGKCDSPRSERFYPQAVRFGRPLPLAGPAHAFAGRRERNRGVSSECKLGALARRDSSVASPVGSAMYARLAAPPSGRLAKEAIGRSGSGVPFGGPRRRDPRRGRIGGRRNVGGRGGARALSWRD